MLVKLILSGLWGGACALVFGKPFLDMKDQLKIYKVLDISTKKLKTKMVLLCIFGALVDIAGLLVINLGLP